MGLYQAMVRKGLALSRKKVALLWSLPFLIFIAVWITRGYQTSPVYFRLTIEAEQDGRAFTSSVLWGAKYFLNCEGPLPPCSRGWLDAKFAGEALRVGTGADALWITVSENIKLWEPARFRNPSRPPMLPVTAWGLDEVNPKAAIEQISRIAHDQAPRPLDVRFLPKIIRFRDRQDPLSADSVPVPPQGEVKILDASISFTDGPITSGISTQLPWLDQPNPFSGSESKASRSSAATGIQITDFRRDEL